MKNGLLIVGGLAAAYLLLSNKSSVGTGTMAGGGGSIADYAALPVVPSGYASGEDAPSFTFNYPEVPTGETTPATTGAVNDHVYGSKKALSAAGATPAAVSNYSTMYKDKYNQVTSQGGIVKTLASGTGYEAVSPAGLGYSTRDASLAGAIASGSSPLSTPVAITSSKKTTKASTSSPGSLFTSSFGSFLGGK